MKVSNSDIGNNYGGIYCVHCNITNKNYIGKTIKPIKRFREYSNLKCKGQPRIYNALKKYGPENFTFEIIDTAVDKIQLSILERLYIQKFDSINNGYNCTEGGDGGFAKGLWKGVTRESPSIETRHKIGLANGIKVICLTTSEIFESAYSANRKYPKASHIGDCCKGKCIASGKLPDGTKLVWKYYDEYLTGLIAT